MRSQFVSSLVQIAEEDPRAVLVTADLGFMALEPFSERFGDRFINAGVSEQNMIGVATGLAEAGYRPYCYSIAPFASLRPLEFIRNGPVQHQLPVRIVGVGGGFEYGTAGPSHHGIDDVGSLRVMPGLTIVAPADAGQVDAVMRAVHPLPGPAYLRLGKDDRRSVRGLDGVFALGRAQQIRQGRDVVLITMGSISSEVQQAADELAAGGVQVSVIVVASINPAPVDDLVQVLAAHRVALTVEAHSVVGGVGSLVAEVIAEHDVRCRLVRLGVRASAHRASGGEAYLHRVHGLDRSSVVEQVRRALSSLEPVPRRAAAVSGRQLAVARP